MIEWKTTNIFDSKCHIWVNAVNCEGIMGKGLALDFKQRFPDMFESYKEWCKNGDLSHGGDWFMWINMQNIFSGISYPTHIICFATKESWKSKSKKEWIERGLKSISEYEWSPNVSIAFPKLGCGLGGLNWITDVKPLMIKYFEPLPIKIEVYV